VLTAAHCLYDIERKLWPEEVLFFPGLNGDSAPFGYFPAEQVDVVAGYVDTPTRVYNWQHLLHDMGLVRLSGRLGRQLGTLGYGYNDRLPPFVGNIVGYPMDLPLGTMWRASCDVDTYKGYPSIFETRCDTFQGSSGSSIYDFDKRTGNRTVYGVTEPRKLPSCGRARIRSNFLSWLSLRCPQAGQSASRGFVADLV
jgi:V8-like Glu-specific endopeptidase